MGVIPPAGVVVCGGREQHGAARRVCARGSSEVARDLNCCVFHVKRRGVNGPLLTHRGAPLGSDDGHRSHVSARRWRACGRTHGVGLDGVAGRRGAVARVRLLLPGASDRTSASRSTAKHRVRHTDGAPVCGSGVAFVYNRSSDVGRMNAANGPLRRGMLICGYLLWTRWRHLRVRPSRPPVPDGAPDWRGRACMTSRILDVGTAACCSGHRTSWSNVPRETGVSRLTMRPRTAATCSGHGCLTPRRGSADLVPDAAPERRVPLGWQPSWVCASTGRAPRRPRPTQSGRSLTRFT